MTQEIKVSIPIDKTTADSTVLAIIKRDIPEWAERYVDWLDTATTDEVCKCEWIIHPDDLNLPALHCRDCRHMREQHYVDGTGIKCVGQIDASVDGQCKCTMYLPRRVRQGDLKTECPVHSPVGRVLGFFEFVFKQVEPENIDH